MPVAFANGLTLIGCELTGDSALVLTTYWRVDRPLTPPLSIFAHAVTDAQEVVAQADGLNVAVSALEPGDVIIQRLLIDQSAGATAINLGLYDPATLKRWPLLPNAADKHIVVKLK